jgi:hypothetical protein
VVSPSWNFEAWNLEAPRRANAKNFILGMCYSFRTLSLEACEGARAIFLHSACLGTFELGAYKLQQGLKEFI